MMPPHRKNVAYPLNIDMATPRHVVSELPIVAREITHMQMGEDGM